MRGSYMPFLLDSTLITTCRLPFRLLFTGVFKEFRNILTVKLHFGEVLRFSRWFFKFFHVTPIQDECHDCFINGGDIQFSEKRNKKFSKFQIEKFLKH